MYCWVAFQGHCELYFRRVSSWEQLACTPTWERKSPNCPPQRQVGENSALQKWISTWVVFGLLHLIVFPVKILYLTEFILGCSVEAGDGYGGLARKSQGEYLRDLKVVSPIWGCVHRLCLQITEWIHHTSSCHSQPSPHWPPDYSLKPLTERLALG